MRSSTTCYLNLSTCGRDQRKSKMSKKYRIEAMAAIHETMETLHDVGAIDKQTMRQSGR